MTGSSWAAPDPGEKRPPAFPEGPRSLLSTAAIRARYRLRSSLSKRPGLYLPLARARYGFAAGFEDPVVGPRTEVVIEGYPRSANGFAVSAFETAQPGPVRIAHHLHAAAQVIRAVRLGIPAIVLVRDPEAAILSRMFLRSYPYRSPGPAAEEYLGFYGPLMPLRDRLVVATFEEVTADFGAVVRRLNERCGTLFVPFEHTGENVARCFERIEANSRRLYGVVREATVSRPSGERARTREALRERFRAEITGRTRERLYETYEAFVSSAG